MSNVKTLEPEILGAISAAGDEAALEAVRVSALGKSGSVSALLKTLGAMTPEQRKEQGPLINGLRDRVSEALAKKRDALKGAAIAERLAADKVDVTLPVREIPLLRGRIHPVTQMLERMLDTATKNNTDLRVRVAKYTTAMTKAGLSTDIAQMKGLERVPAFVF